MQNTFLKNSYKIPQILQAVNLPSKVFLLGYGAIGKAFIETLFANFPFASLTVMDLLPPPNDLRFKYIQHKITKNSISTILDHVKAGDILVDLSTNIDCVDIWSQCMNNGVMYLNTAMEEWEDSENPISFPKSHDDLYKTSLLYRHDEVRNHPSWKTGSGTSSIFEHGMNPGLISHFAKKGIYDAASYFLEKKDAKEFSDLNFDLIKKYLTEKNYAKLAQAIKLHTIHCSEKDDQFIIDPPKDTKEKFYNTWSCRGFLTEGMVPIQIARGSHEDENSEEFPRVQNGKLIMSWAPSNHYWGN